MWTLFSMYVYYTYTTIRILYVYYTYLCSEYRFDLNGFSEEMLFDFSFKSPVFYIHLQMSNYEFLRDVLCIIEMLIILTIINSHYE